MQRAKREEQSEEIVLFWMSSRQDNSALYALKHLEGGLQMSSPQSNNKRLRVDELFPLNGSYNLSLNQNIIHVALTHTLQCVELLTVHQQKTKTVIVKEKHNEPLSIAFSGKSLALHKVFKCKTGLTGI